MRSPYPRHLRDRRPTDHFDLLPPVRRVKDLRRCEHDRSLQLSSGGPGTASPHRSLDWQERRLLWRPGSDSESSGCQRERSHTRQRPTTRRDKPLDPTSWTSVQKRFRKVAVTKRPTGEAFAGSYPKGSLSDEARTLGGSRSKTLLAARETWRPPIDRSTTETPKSNVSQLDTAAWGVRVASRYPSMKFSAVCRVMSFIV